MIIVCVYGAYNNKKTCALCGEMFFILQHITPDQGRQYLYPCI